MGSLFTALGLEKRRPSNFRAITNGGNDGTFATEIFAKLRSNFFTELL